MSILITPEQAKDFQKSFATPSFAREERDYKWAVHLLVSRLLSEQYLKSEQFPRLLSALMQGKLDLADIGLSKAEQELIERSLSPGGGQYQALANLCGGRWGVPNLDWIPIAVEHGLGAGLQSAFRAFLDLSVPLAARINTFRDDVKDLQAQLRDLGGFRPKWQIIGASFQFIGMILGAYDPTQYTFYHAGNLRAALEVLGGAWPRMKGGERYAQVCKLVQETHRALLGAGVEVRDLIDTQSLLFIYGDKLTKKPGPPPKPNGEQPGTPSQDAAEALAQATLWSIDRARMLIELAERGKPLLFSGPPGTGKTFVARALAQAVALDDDHIEVVQFHPSYAYEDFMEGIRPRIGDTGGTIRYDIQPGIFRRVAKSAEEDPDSTYVLIIDEINRANLPRVLGEVLYCIEYRGRDGAIRLPYSEEEFFLPENVLIIGTMNTADRSIALVDAALRRRFLVLSFAPDLDVLRRWWANRGNPSKGEEAATRLEKLNAELANRLDAHRLIGHTYLMDEHIADEGFENVWEWQLKPVLEEHLYAHPDDVEQLWKVFLEG